jgi:subtilisin-like proprotein convertase family protein
MKKILTQAYSTSKKFPQCVRALAAIAALSLSSSALAITIVGSQGGPIPDNSFVGSLVRFDVAGVSGQQVSNVIVRLDMTHTWVGDLTAILIAPNNAGTLRLFGRIGAGRSVPLADSSNFSGNYEFNDLGGSDIWAAAAGVDSAGNVPIGSYRTTTVANPGVSNVGGCSSYLQLAFGGLRSNQINGQWQLIVYDSAIGDTGSVNASNTALEIQTVAETPEPSLFRAGFEDNDVGAGGAAPLPITASNIVGNCTPGINSPTGSGLTDFVMARNNAGAVEWRIKQNDLTASGLQFGPFVFGRNTDAIFMGDYDGDGYSDAAVWSPSSARFRVRRSSRPSDVPLQFNLGQTGDVAQIAADFDGDRVTDFAVFRPGTTANPNVSYLIRKSTTGLVSSFPISNVPNAIGFTLRDANSDGRADFSVQYNDGAGNGAFQIFSGVDGAFLSNFNFGLATDFVVPGQFVGDAVTDIAVSRNINFGANIKYAFTRDTATGVGDATMLASGIAFGVVGDSITQGDYDGDGIVDFAVWRPAAAGQSRFVIRRSTNIATPLEVFQGESGDYPVNNWDVH